MGNLCSAAIDLGGTKIISACFSPGMELLGRPVETPTRARSRPGEIVDNICSNLEQSLSLNGISAKELGRLGLGVPTTIQYEKGLIDLSPNLPTMSDFPLGRLLEDRLGVPVAMENDANCFALGEAVHGAGRGFSSCCGITLGTGLGLGIVLGGELYRGSSCCAGEIWKSWHGDDLLENHASGPALAGRYLQITGNACSGEQVYRKALKAEPEALEVFQDLGRALGQGLSYLVNILDPGIVVFGGSAAQAFDLFIGPLEEEIARYRVARNATRFVGSALGKLAPLFGAASLKG
ncbi:MAG: ROK family protein [Candidatus Glassbacteria bacterium]|nr:ROK family protein [Candidatus Glassbacteria bacterium]